MAGPKKKQQREKSGPEKALPNAETVFSQEPIVGPEWLGPVFCLLALVVFALTACRTVPGGDSGELISVAANLGVAHPPGYPLWTMLAHLSTYVPIGNIAWRINMFSALFAVASGYMIYLIASRWVRDRWLAVTAAALFIFSPLAWRYAVVAEVFTMNNFFIATLLYMTMRFDETPTPKWAYAWIGTLGLACSHHHTIIFLAIPLFIMLLRRHSKVLLNPKVFFTCLGIYAVCLLPYLFLPWAAKKKLVISWGQADTWDGFWTHFMRKEYGTFQLATGDTNFLNIFSNLKFYSMDMWLQMLVIGVPIAFFGIWQAIKGPLRQDRFAPLLIWGFVTYVLVFHFFANMDLSNRLFYDVQSRFWLLPNMILVLFLAAGLKIILARWPERAVAAKWSILGIVLVAQIGIHYEREDHSKNTVFYDLGKGLLDGMPPGALAFMRGDVYVNSVRYLQSVENYRTDVIAIPFDLLWWPWMRGVVEAHHPNVRFPGRVYRYTRSNLREFTLRDFFELNEPNFPSYLGKLADHETNNVKEKFQILPVGFMNRILPLSKPFNYQLFKEDVERFAVFKPPLKTEIREKSWEAFVYYNYWDRELEITKVLFEHGVKSGENPEMLLYGASILEKMARDYPEANAGVWRNLGVAYQILARRDQQYYIKMVEAWRKYLSFSPTDDPQIGTIRQAVATAQGAPSVTVPTPGLTPPPTKSAD